MTDLVCLTCGGGPGHGGPCACGLDAWDRLDLAELSITSIDAEPVRLVVVSRELADFLRDLQSPELAPFLPVHTHERLKRLLQGAAPTPADCRPRLVGGGR